MLNLFKRQLVFVGIIILFGSLFLSLYYFFNLKNPTPKYKQITINSYNLTVEIADNPKSQELGLSSRKYLPKNHGMLFIFPKSGFYRFWMKGMNFPLDFVWINSNKIVDITENVPNPLSKINDLKLMTYSPKFPSDKVLEINAGTVRSFGIKIGDKIRF